jgi:hypothetical protein
MGWGVWEGLAKERGGGPGQNGARAGGGRGGHAFGNLVYRSLVMLDQGDAANQCHDCQDCSCCHVKV